MANSPLVRFCCVIALADLLAFYGFVLWLVHDQAVLAALAGVVALNLAMGWLLVAGVSRDEAGNRVWSSRPAVACILLSIVVAVGLFFWAVTGNRP